MDGYVNSQNYRKWSTENPHEYCEDRLLPSKVGVWCAISWQRVVGPIFKTTIMSDVYADILMQFIVLLEEDERDCIFQQDEARPHTSKESMTMLLCGFFGDRLVSTTVYLSSEWS